MRFILHTLMTTCLLALTGCVTTLKPGVGSITNNVYASQSGLFKVPVPVQPQFGGRIDDNPYTVIFTDDFGTLYRIEAVYLPDEESQMMTMKGKKGYLKWFMSDYYMPMAIQQVSTEAEIVHESWNPDIQEGAFYSEVIIPEGSISAVSVNGGPAQRVKAQRGVLLFTKNKVLYIISCGLGFTPNFNKEDDNFERLRPMLEERTTEFTKEVILPDIPPPPPVDISPQS